MALKTRSKPVERRTGFTAPRTLYLQPLTLSRDDRVEKPGPARTQDEATAEKPFRPIFPILFVKQRHDSAQTIKKTDSEWLSLATIP